MIIQDIPLALAVSRDKDEDVFPIGKTLRTLCGKTLGSKRLRFKFAPENPSSWNDQFFERHYY
jgi:hypothetical protein